MLIMFKRQMRPEMCSYIAEWYNQTEGFIFQMVISSFQEAQKHDFILLIGESENAFMPFC